MGIPTQVKLLVKPHTNNERRHNREITASLVVFVVQASRQAQSGNKKAIKGAGLMY